QKAPLKAEKSEPMDKSRPNMPLWFLAFLAAAFLSGFAGAGILFNLPIYMNDIGFSVGKISIVASAYAASMVLGKFVLGILYDRVGTKTATLIAGLLMTLTCVFLIF